MDLRLAEKSVLVGGASRGIGRAIARAFLAEGARVAIVARGQGDLEATARALRDEFGHDRAHSVVADVTNAEGVGHAIRSTVDTFGRLDVLVPNVGRGRYLAGPDVPMTEWVEVLTVNLLGSMELARQALPELERAGDGGGAIVFVSSIAGVETIGAPVAYEAAKAALLSATKALARSLGPRIRVNAVAPGNVLFPGGSWDRRRAEQPDRVQKMLETDVPMRRFGTVEEIAAGVVFLASPVAGFTTGSCLVMDGGQTHSW